MVTVSEKVSSSLEKLLQKDQDTEQLTKILKQIYSLSNASIYSSGSIDLLSPCIRVLYEKNGKKQIKTLEL